MSRFLPLIILVIWMCGHPASPIAGLSAPVACAIFFGFYFLMFALLAMWSHRVAGIAHLVGIQRRVRRFNAVVYAGRILIPAWLAVGVFVLGWKRDVWLLLDRTPLGGFPIDCPGILLGCSPPFLAWMALWWAQFPADRALREQNILIQLDQSLPLQPPPSFRTYFLVNLRLQILFTIAPVLLLLAMHDALMLAGPPIFRRLGISADHGDLIETLVTLAAMTLIVIFIPELLRRVLQTETLPDCPLRRRLMDVARANRIGFRDVLLWKTHNQMGNAAVMGFVPRFRYVLLSDLLLETMPDEQIEAIFAHEIGHVRHRHLLWLLAAIGAMLLAVAGPGQIIADALQRATPAMPLNDTAQTIVLLGAALGLFALAFGYVSRKFERQADVFAARTIQDSSVLAEAEPAAPASAPESVSVAVLEAPRVAPPPSHVGRYGAAVFCAALERVAVVNNIPTAARSWCHGSIAKRMQFLEKISHDSRQTTRFDRLMRRLYLVLALSLLVFGVWATFVLQWQGGQ